jgi:hypothetical protein
MPLSLCARRVATIAHPDDGCQVQAADRRQSPPFYHARLPASLGEGLEVGVGKKPSVKGIRGKRVIEKNLDKPASVC